MRMEREKRLGRQDWMRAARRALLKGGAESVRVEKLARDLRVTKGSFYWHFKDRDDILESLLREWEEETATLTGAARRHADPGEGLRGLLDTVKETVVLSERGEAPSDAAMFAWAAVSPEVARRVNQVERRRLAFFTELTGSPNRAELGYYAYLGFIMRRRRVPEAAAHFPMLAEMLYDLFLDSGPESRPSKSNLRKKRK